MRERKADIVITGVGVCCNLGDDLEAILEIVRGGKPGHFERYDRAVEMQTKCQIYAPYRGDVSDAALGIKRMQSRFMGTGSRIALKASLVALAQSKLERRDIGLVFSQSTGDIQTHIETQAKLDETKTAKGVAPTMIPKTMASTVSANLVNVLKTTGPSFSATAACTTGAYNILLAAELIRAGHMDAALVGGAEAVNPHMYAGFDAMGAFNTVDNDRPERASRPYAADRAGFVIGEGAGALVLERREDAERRGATILGTLVGWGMSSDGLGEMVAPSPAGALACMRAAIKHTGIAADEIDYVNTHGTSTPLGDVSEVKAMRELFAGRQVSYSSTKGYTGHTQSAAGAIEAIFTLMMVNQGWIAPSIHADPLDPQVEDFPPLRVPTVQTSRYVMSNSFGFGGTNASLLMTS